MSVKIATVVDVNGQTYEVKTTKSGNIMLCGEWMCTEMSTQAYASAVSNGRFTIVC